MQSSFFRPGKISDSKSTYSLVRDDPDFADQKSSVERLWAQYRHLADSHFQADAQNHFHQRFWEMYLGCTLIQQGFNLKRVSGNGLEYYFMVGHRRVWVEAVAPEAGEGNNRVPAYEPSDEMTPVPVDQIILRITSVVATKLNAYRAAVDKGLIAPDEQFLLAINPRAIPDWPLRAEIPYFIKALLPFGAYAFELGDAAEQSPRAFHVKRSSLLKSSRSPVSTTALLDEDSKPMVAVLHSCVDVVNQIGTLGADFDVLHNPNAAENLSAECFRWADQYFYSNGRLRVEPKGGA